MLVENLNGLVLPPSKIAFKGGCNIITNAPIGIIVE